MSKTDLAAVADVQADYRVATPVAGESAPRIDALTSLRFFAALYVLFLHSGSSALSAVIGDWGAPIVNFTLNGYLGVSLFFVLSGFILSHVYKNKIVGSASTKKYLLARFARIYPVYLISVILAAATLQYHPEAGVGSAWPQFFLLHSWLPLETPIRIQLWNPPAWTLSVELGFYLAFPLISILILRSTGWAIGFALAMSMVMIGAATPSAAGRPLVWEWLGLVPLPIVKLPEFMLGIAMYGIVSGSPGARLQRYAPTILAIGLLVSVVSLAISTSAWISGFAAVGFAIVIAAVYALPRGALVTTLLEQRWLVFLGGASYCIYILQTPVRYILEDLVFGDGIVTKLAYYPVLIIVSGLCFHYIEEPARQLIKQRAARP